MERGRTRGAAIWAAGVGERLVRCLVMQASGRRGSITSIYGGEGGLLAEIRRVVGPSVLEDNGRLAIWPSDTAVAEEAKLRRTSAGRRVRPSPSSDRFEPPARDAHRVIVAFTWQAGTNPVIIAEYYLSDTGSVMLSCAQLVLDTHHNACLHARRSESLVAPSTLPSQLS